MEKTELFAGISKAEITCLLDCLSASVRSVPKEAFVFHAGDVTEEMGLVLSGAVRMEENDLWGGRSIMGSAGPGEVFAETYACAGKGPLMVDVIASKPSEILFLKLQKVFGVCREGCGFHVRLLGNLAVVMAGKNLALTRKIRLITPKSLRERILAYLSLEARQQGKGEITIPFNRQQMADYLNVDRSALSGELSRMKKEGLIEYSKNRFILHSNQP